ncbi:DUF4266 domain-containing protein [Vibrio makurazakiensis]|uniref:DUF4266 domain-containing protein n=1 Tax=Vibrio makurazakiensis TaxID=2910250 RepID=UPI003D1326E3
MIRASLFVGSLLIPVLSIASPKVDLSGLGKKPIKEQVSVSKNGNYEEEVISSTIYNSADSDLGTRRNIELIKPTSEQLSLKEKANTEPEQEQPSALAFVDEALGIKPVKPWEKGTLAKKEMKPGGPVPEFDVFSEKVFAYKQGSVGGSGVGGGGCGCN